MKQILVIEDDPEYAGRIRKALSGTPELQSGVLRTFSGLSEARQALQENKAALVVLDLIFEKEKVNALLELTDVLGTYPVVIVSDYVHYRKLAYQTANVKAFISKDSLERDLPGAVARCLCPETATFPKNLVFPADKPSDTDETVPLGRVLFFETYGRNRYAVHLTDGDTLLIRSKKMSDLMEAVSGQGISILVQVSRGEVIHASLIRTIERNRSGRLEVRLFGEPGRVFTVGKKYEKSFRELFFDIG